MMTSRRITTLILFVCIFYGGCKETNHEQSARPDFAEVPVEIAQVRSTPVRYPVEIIGTVESAHKAEIAAKITGTISSMPVGLGSEVSKGDLLVELNAAEREAQLLRAKAELNQAQRNLARERKLLEKNAATPESVKSHQEKLDIAEATYQEISTMLSYTRILAPFSGRITHKEADIGDMATIGKTLLTLEDENRLQVVTEIPEAMLIKLNVSDSLPVSIPAAQLELTGSIAELSPTANPTTRTGQAKLNVPVHSDLRSGMFARVLLENNAPATLTVPAEALRINGQLEMVFVVTENKAQLRLVRSGTKTGDRVEILAGVHQGEQVVVSAQQTLHDGQPVIIQ